MDVLVTGGTGFVGREVVRQLLAAGHRPRVLVRNAQSPRARALAGSGAELAVGDALTGSGLATAAAGSDAVIHLVGIIGEIGPQTFENAHPGATGNLLQAARHVGLRRFVHMSALGTRPAAVARYHRTKWAAEQLVRASGLDWTIFRPSLIYGAEDSFVNLFHRLSRWSPVLPIMGSGRAQLQPVAVETVAACFVRALEVPAARGGTYDVCGRERLSLVEVVDALLEVTGRRRLKVHWPLPLARALAACLEWVFPRLLDRAAPLNRDQLLMLQEDNVGDPVPAEVLFAPPIRDFRDELRRRFGGG